MAAGGLAGEKAVAETIIFMKKKKKAVKLEGKFV